MFYAENEQTARGIELILYEVKFTDTVDGTSEDRTWGFQNDTGPKATL